MNSSGNNTAVSRGQGPRSPSRARTETQAPVTTFPTYLPYGMTINQPPRFSASPFAPGPYDMLGDFHTYKTTAALPVNDTTKESHTTHGKSRHPIQTASSSTRAPAGANAPAEVIQSHASTPTRQISDCVMLYVSLAAKPPALEKIAGGAMHPAHVLRVIYSTKWYLPKVRAALWSSPDTRRKVFEDSAKAPPPLSFAEACKVDLRHISTAVLPEMPQENFWQGMRRFYPCKDDIKCHISEWAMGCPNCDEEVIGYATDTHWSERYLHHRANVCGKSHLSTYHRWIEPLGPGSFQA